VPPATITKPFHRSAVTGNCVCKTGSLTYPFPAIFFADASLFLVNSPRSAAMGIPDLAGKHLSEKIPPATGWRSHS
jgi:hypothetical protein